MATGLCAQTFAAGDQPSAVSSVFSIHPDNSHYFRYKGKPTVIVTSGEHYGAVLNRAFDHSTYLATLAADGLNGTRVFSGAYCEQPGAFKIARNTLAPAEGDLICPWARSGTPGYHNGGNKFDLDRWDEGYFERLKAFLTQAASRDIIVEYVFFCPFYNEGMWNLSPLNPANHVNAYGKGITQPNQTWTLKENRGLLEVQEELIRRVTAELNEFDNLYYEVCNEPYVRELPQDWHDHLAHVIADAEKDLPKKHLISWNVANKKKQIEKPDPVYGLFNFHYANPPETVAMNWQFDRPIGDNETGFKGQDNRVYRREAWEFLLAGGALFNHLDYSFAVGHEKGTFEYPPEQPGGGNAAFRKEMSHLARFINGFDFLRMKPDPSVLHAGKPKGEHFQALAEPGRQYALYLSGGKNAELKVDLPAGKYAVEWFSPLTGSIDKREVVSAQEGEPATLRAPVFTEDIAIALRRVSEE